MKMNKGQAVLIDFAVGFLLFILALGFINAQFDLKIDSANEKANLKEMRLKADFALDFLVKSQGEPNNWESLTIDELEKPGLATKDRLLSEAKLSSFSNFSSDYESMKSKLELEAYDFFFEFSGVDDVTAGLQAQSNANQIVVERIVRYKNEIGTARLVVYDLK